MELIVKTDNLAFMYHLKRYLIDEFILKVDFDRLKDLSNILNINCHRFLLKALTHMNIYKYDDNSYVLRFNEEDLSTIRLITYGNLHTHGYDIVYKLFEYTKDNIVDIYNRLEA